MLCWWRSFTKDSNRRPLNFKASRALPWVRPLSQLDPLLELASTRCFHWWHEVIAVESAMSQVLSPVAWGDGSWQWHRPCVVITDKKCWQLALTSSKCRYRLHEVLTHGSSISQVLTSVASDGSWQWHQPSVVTSCTKWWQLATASAKFCQWHQLSFLTSCASLWQLAVASAKCCHRLHLRWWQLAMASTKCCYHWHQVNAESV